MEGPTTRMVGHVSLPLPIKTLMGDQGLDFILVPLLEFRSMGMQTIGLDVLKKIMRTGMEIPSDSAKCARKQTPGHVIIVKFVMRFRIVRVIVPVRMTLISTLQKTHRLGARFIGIWYKRAATNEGEGAVGEVR